MATRRLYWDDPFRFSMEAPVAAVTTHDGWPAVVLAETIVYPEAGGQLGDRGTLAWGGQSVPLVDAQEDEQGRVLHLLDGPAPAEGTRVRIDIDPVRRREHMSQHTGQHMLSRALLDVADAPTVSSRLGDQVCTIDTPLETLSESKLQAAVDLVNDVVLEDRPVRAFLPTPEVLARLPLRRDPKVASDVRVIEIEGFDVSPCGGTHVLRTGQVGPVHVTGVERYKGGLRISFETGRRALRDLAAKDRLLSTIAKDLTCGWAELPAVLAKMRESSREALRAADAMRTRLAEAIAQVQLERAVPDAQGVKWVAVPLGDDPPELVRAVAAVLARRPDVVAIVWGGKDAIQLVVERHVALGSVDAGAVLKALAAACGGKGGGRGARAEGRLPTGADVAAALASVRPS